MKAEDIFLAALEMKTPLERRAYLDSVCRDDAELRAQVESLLHSHQAAGSFLDAPLFDSPPTIDQPAAEKAGAQIGPYKLLQQIGEGGFGIVFMAEQLEPVHRCVALKVIKPGMDTHQVIARFEQERQALALMDHPNIAKVFDAGTTANGRPFFVMELIRGVPVTQYCDEHRLSPKERLELFLPICQAVQHAHQKGIIHRDIKPTNVLVTMHDGQPLVKAIDFGVAKATGQQLTEKTLFTGFAQMIGTPLYMSPEQAEQTSQDIDTRTDIYSLGVLLYELLTGTTPFEKQRFRQATFDEIRRIIREEEPPRPSQRLSSLGGTLPSISTLRHMGPRALRKLVRGDLDWIVMKAIEKDRNRRYETANGFARDVQRYLNDEPVLARPPSAVYRFSKFARRNKTSLAVAALLVLFIAFLAGIVREWATRRAGIAREQATHRARLADDLKSLLYETQTLRNSAVHLVDGNPLDWKTTLSAALAAHGRAEGLANSYPGSLDPQLASFLSNLKTILQGDEQDRQFIARFDEIRLEASRVDVVNNHFISSEQSPQIRALFKHHGIEFGKLSPEEAANWVRSRPGPVQKHLLAAFDVWLAGQGAEPADVRRWVFAVVKSADGDRWRTQARQAVIARDSEALDKVFQDPEASVQSVVFLLLLADAIPEHSGPTKLKLLGQVQSRHPGDFWANEELALALSRADPPQWSEAVRFHSAAVSLRPENPGVWLNLGRALREMGDIDGAESAYRKAIRFAPNFLEAHRNLATILQARGDVDGAMKAYHRAYHSLGVTLYNMHNLAEANAAFRQAIGAMPNNYLSHDWLGFVLLAQGDVESAVASFHEACRLCPNYSSVHFRLGHALRQKGDGEGAAAAYRKALEVEPGFAEAEAALKSILEGKPQKQEGAFSKSSADSRRLRPL